ncbi:MAG: 5-deoxy-glucuronate isomerase [Lewinella sp.]|uniref:5-deoxy-glucuronate isomerase n=1 Tax=Lewinella sp. TaxID=2004506 RepID=UPI003D6AEE73
MVQPKTIGKTKTISPQSPKERRHDLQVMVPQKNEIRKVEAFNAIPAPGVQEIITEENSSFEFLRLARIVLQEGTASRSLDKAEAVYYINRGEVSITANGQTHTLGKGDVLYVSVDSEVSFSSKEFCDVSEFKAVSCHTKYPDKLVRHTDIEGTELAADLGSQRPMSERTVFKLVDKNVQANRLLFGDTYMAHRGGVGSYPPHFHGPDGPHGLGANAKEEIYHFRCETEIEGDIPYVLQNCALPEEKVNVYAHIFDEVAINVTPTYHDTIAPPAVDFMFTWCLASFTEGHRDWAEIYNKPGYENEW